MQPHLKLNAAMGCLARTPLPGVRTLSFPDAQLGPVGGAPGGGGGLPASASTSSLASRASQHSSQLAAQLAEAWRPYLK